MFCFTFISVGKFFCKFDVPLVEYFSEFPKVDLRKFMGLLSWEIVVCFYVFFIIFCCKSH